MNTCDKFTTFSGQTKSMERLFLGQQHIHLKECVSTNEMAQRLLKDQPPEGAVISADQQTAGRGQGGTRWQAAAGQNILMSAILYPRFLMAKEAYALGQMVALAVWRSIHEQLPEADLHIKWPNDILLNGRKVAGILIENQLQDVYVKSSIIGIGINVNQAIFPPGSGRPTSLFLDSGTTFDKHKVMECCWSHLEAMYMRLRQHGATSCKRDFEARMWGYKQRIPLAFDGETHLVTVQGVDPQGRLQVQLADNTLRVFDHKTVAWVWD